jgi:ubiquinone/menaquinone biosynthesis C-methylase UbiE
MVAERGADVVGIDIPGPMLGIGRENARAAAVDDHLEFTRGDAGRLPFPDDAFDAVFAVRFFHLADTPAAFLSEMARVARETVFFDTFNAASARSVYNWLLPMGSRLYSKREVERLIDEADLDLRSAAHDFVVPYGIYRSLPGGVARPLRDADTALGRTPLGRRLATVSYWTLDVA